MTNTARDFSLQLGALVALYVSLSFLLVLVFGLINLLFPDALDAYYQIESAQSSIRLGIAMTLVFFPTYIILTRLVNTHRRKENEGSYLGVTRWLIYLSLLIGGGALLGDLVAVIVYFLEGEITIRFVLKALAVLVVVGAAFTYYLLDARGYWLTREKISIRSGIASIIVVVVVLLLGFSNISTPSEVRERKLDQQQITDLRDMQWRVIEYYQTSGTLPEEINDVYVTEMPQAPETRTSYRYELIDGGFSLCASFAYPSELMDGAYSSARPVMPIEKGISVTGTENWDHKAGDWCFIRTISDESK